MDDDYISDIYLRLPIQALNLREKISSDGAEWEKLVHLLGGNQFNQHPKVKENSWLQLFLPGANVPQSNGHLPLASINDRDQYGFWMAVAHLCGRQDVINTLMKYGTNMNPSSYNHEPLYTAGIYGGTALHHGCFCGDSKYIEAILNAGADPTVQNQFGRTCIETAARYGHEEAWKVAVARHEETQKNKTRQERRQRRRRQRFPALTGGELEALFDVFNVGNDGYSNSEQAVETNSAAHARHQANNDSADHSGGCNRTGISGCLDLKRGASLMSNHILVALCVMSAVLLLNVVVKEGEVIFLKLF